MNILIIGANGFIGSHLSEVILAETDWTVTAMDLRNDNLSACLGHTRFHFHQGDMTQEKVTLARLIQESDVVLPLAAIATPATYVQDPLRVFELDFEANLAIVRQCVEFRKRLVFPSTSEVYGMCPDAAFDEETSPLVTGPVHRERWIYSTSKQLMDRVIHAYGKHHGLSYTLFRPFNWYGPRLDSIHNIKKGGSRVLTQFIGNLLRGEDIQLVDGGAQQRCFMHIDDGMRALLAILRNDNQAASGQIFNIGNPEGNLSIRQLAEMLVEYMGRYPACREAVSQARLVSVPAENYYGAGYQDVSLRVPAIRAAKERLGWVPRIDVATGLQKTLDVYFG